MRSTKKLVSTLVLSLLVLVSPSILGQSAGQAEYPAGGAAAQAPTPKPYEEILKLWQAKLSEDFIRRQIEASPVVYDLSTEDIIRCRDAGLPENIINMMLATQKRPPAGTGAAPAAAGAPASSAPSAAQAHRTWEGLVRRNSGVVLLKSRWDIGTLEFKEQTFRWADAKDPSKNLLVPARQITEQFMTCVKKAGGNECFEWGFKTKSDQYQFRDVSWEMGENKKVLELYDFFKAIYPSLVSAERPVDKK